MSPALCRMIPVPIWPRRQNITTCAARVLQPRMVLTIEPGIYFIESLLAPWLRTVQQTLQLAEKLKRWKPFGGIRIEDNVVIHENSIENMTRDLKLA